MPIYDHIDYTPHAVDQMKSRCFTEADVELVLRLGNGRPGKRGKWIFELGNIHVVIEYESSARIITVIRLRGKR